MNNFKPRLVLSTLIALFSPVLTCVILGLLMWWRSGEIEALAVMSAFGVSLGVVFVIAAGLYNKFGE